MRYFILIFFLISVLHTRSQEPAYKQFTVKDGLPGSVVYHALQDKNGFIWFATSLGISRWRVTDKQQAGSPASGTIIHLSFPLIP